MESKRFMDSFIVKNAGVWFPISVIRTERNQVLNALICSIGSRKKIHICYSPSWYDALEPISFWKDERVEGKISRHIDTMFAI